MERTEHSPPRLADPLFHSALDALPVAAYICDTEGRISHYNEAAVQLWGRRPVLRDSEERFCGSIRLFHADGSEMPRTECWAARALRDGVPYCDEKLIIERPDGTRRHGRAHTRPIHGADGALIGVINVLLDTTEQERVDDELAVRLRQQRVVAELGSAALQAELDLPDFLQQVTERVARTLDVELCKVLELQPDGKSLLLRAGVGWKPGMAGTAIVMADRNSQAGFTLETERPVLVEDLASEARFQGPSLLIEHNVVSGMSVIIGDCQEPLGILGAHSTSQRRFSEDDARFLQMVANLVADVLQRLETRRQLDDRKRHEQEHIERELERVEAELVREARLSILGKLSAQMAHDLRNPLCSIRNASYYLRQITDDTEAQSFLDIINEELTSCEYMIRNLLEVTRPHETRPDRINLGELVGAAFTRLRVSAAVQLEFRSSEHPFFIHADPVRMRQLMDNLLDNAADAVSAEGRIEVIATHRPDGDQIEIRDTGCGVPADLRDKVFDLLVTTKAKGTGLGLSICRQIVEQHGGTISLDCTDGTGTSFMIHLPRTDRAGANVPSQSAAGSS